MKNLIQNSLNECSEVLNRFLNNPESVSIIEKAATLIAEALARGNKVISCGNGGSLCDATHFAEELTGRYRHNRLPFPAISINDPAYITCVANDFGFEYIFSRYVESVGKEGDVLLAITTSGTSANVLKAMETAQGKGMSVICLTGKMVQQAFDLSDVYVCAQGGKYSDRVQEIHIKVIHILIEAVENLLDKKGLLY